MDDRSVDVSNPGDTIVVGIVVVDDDDVIVVILLFKLLLLVEEEVGVNIPYPEYHFLYTWVYKNQNAPFPPFSKDFLYTGYIKNLFS